MKHLPALLLLTLAGCYQATAPLHLADVPADAYPEWADPLDVDFYEVEFTDYCQAWAPYAIFYGATEIQPSGVFWLNTFDGADWSGWFEPVALEIADDCEDVVGQGDALLLDGWLYVYAHDYRDGGVAPVVVAEMVRVMVGGGPPRSTTSASPSRSLTTRPTSGWRASSSAATTSAGTRRGSTSSGPARSAASCLKIRSGERWRRDDT